MSGYEILSLDEVEPLPGVVASDALLLPLSRLLGLRAFGANCWTAEVGKRIVPRHAEESGDEELYVVVRGRATFTVGEETFAAPAGTLVHAPPGVVREAFADEAGTLVLAVGATPGKPYSPRGWDGVVVAFAHASAGRVEDGRRTMREVAAAHPDDWESEYNLACFEARFGDRDAAYDHLRRAATRAPEDVRRVAPGDADLASLRGDPRWQEVLG